MSEARVRIKSLEVRNFRALKHVKFHNLTPLTALLGPNGCGKSTVFDVFAFLSECFALGMRSAWDRRNRARELKTRGAEGPIVIEIKYREGGFPLTTYRLAVDERCDSPVVVEEWMQWKRGASGRTFRFLEYSDGQGRSVGGEFPDERAERVEMPLKSSDLIAVNALGQFENHPRVAALREFIAGWHVSRFSAAETHGQPDMGPQERLSGTGGNVANVLQYLAERDPERLEDVFAALRWRVPCIERASAEAMPNGRLLLQFKDVPFSRPVLARFTSDGTLKLFAYLLLLCDPSPPPFIGIEEPENFLHPRLVPELAQECRLASARSQLLITTHSPFFINALKPEEVRILYRDEQGYTQVLRAADAAGLPQFVNAGAALGELWMEGRFGAGDPLVRSGAPDPRRKSV